MGSSLALSRSSFAGNCACGPDGYSGGAIQSEGGMVNAVDCIFAGNSSRFGGAIFGSVNLNRCAFVNNSINGYDFPSGGGAIFGGGTIDQCTFIGNSASDTNSFGGGALSGSYTVTRSTFIDNEAVSDNGPVASALQGSGTLEDCIVRGGTSPRVSANVTATFANIEGGFPGTGIIDQPESFWPDFGLLPDSPSIDVGNPAAPLDADGSRRDLGAFPFDPFRCEEGCSTMIGTATCTANVNSTGVGATLSALGTSTATGDLVVLNVQDTPPGSLGYFLTAGSGGSLPLGGGSQGLLCLSGNVLRFSNTVLNDRGTGTVSFRAPLASFPQGTTVMAGDSWHFQYWFRDANPQSTSNTSSAVQITFQ